MIYQERLLKIIKSPYVSEKTSMQLEKFNVVVFLVEKYATKTDIKNAVHMLFSVTVKSVTVLIIPGKAQGIINNVKRCNSWKKAYVVLKKGHKINYVHQVK